MALEGWFDPDLVRKEWFDDSIKGWFDESLVAATSGGVGTSYSLSCANGSYTYTGQATGQLKRVHSLTCSVGSYTYTGQSSGLLKTAHRLTCAVGSYTYTGQSITTALAHRITAANGSYAYTGKDATLAYVPGASKVDYSLSCSNGSYSYTGKAIAVVRSVKLTASSGSYSVVGQSSGLLKVAHSLTCSVGSYAFTGQSANLRQASQITASSGSYSVSGQVVTLPISRAVSLDHGVYSLTGIDATLAYSGGNTAYSLECANGSYHVATGYASEDYFSDDYSTDNTSFVYVSKAGSAGGHKPRRVYIERDGEIYIFPNAIHAAAFIAAEKAQEKPVTPSVTKEKKPAKQLAKIKPIKQPEIIKIDALKLLAQKHGLNDIYREYEQYLRQKDYEALYCLHRMLMDEEDIEILLLAA